MDGIRVLELYSGIGGMHFALKDSHPSAKVLAAVDINPVANDVYRHNFPDVQVMENGIEGFSVKQLEKFDFNLILMSPPCQPFTRIGLQKDIADPRTKSFLHFLDLLPKLRNLPSILLENVKGFETSEAYRRLCNTLDECGYHRQGFLLSPKHLGIPNARLRYYMLAKMDKFHQSVMNEKGNLWEVLPEICTTIKSETTSTLQPPINEQISVECVMERKILNENKCVQRFDSIPKHGDVSMKTIQDYLEENIYEEYKVPLKTKSRYIGVMDIVTPDSMNSTCFTKSYAQYAEGTGSILNLNKMTKTSSETESSERNPEDFDLRYFTPREIANLLGFPQDFTFPYHITRKQRYRLLGNSLNVEVVSYLLKLLFLKCENT